jgi:hypothetical protein
MPAGMQGSCTHWKSIAKAGRLEQTQPEVYLARAFPPSSWLLSIITSNTEDTQPAIPSCFPAPLTDDSDAFFDNWIAFAEDFVRSHKPILDRCVSGDGERILLFIDPTRRDDAFLIKKLGWTSFGELLPQSCEIIKATLGTSRLCSRCYTIFLDPRNAQALFEKDHNLSRRFEHHTISEFQRCALFGCSLCSVVVLGRLRKYTFDRDNQLDGLSSFAISQVNDDWDIGIRLSVGHEDVRFHYFASGGKSTILASFFPILLIGDISGNPAAAFIPHRPPNTDDGDERTTGLI